MDGSKFDSLSEQLSNLFTCSSLSLESYESLTSEYLTPCLLKLCVYIKDDYQLKTLNLKVHIYFMINFRFYCYFDIKSGEFRKRFSTSWIS